jgi:hypothetical protein
VVIENELNFIGAVLILSAALITAYLSIKLKGAFRIMTIALTAFIVLHGIYHVANMQGSEFLSEAIIEPASVIALIAFGAVYLHIAYCKNNKQETAER